MVYRSYFTRLPRAALWVVVFGVSTLSAQVALVRHAPTLNGRVEGSVQQMTAESATFSRNLLKPTGRDDSAFQGLAP